MLINNPPPPFCPPSSFFSFLCLVCSLLFPPPLFHNLFALCLSNKSHLIVHFLSWPGAWCQTSCMKCSFTAFPASTFVQRRNNKKKNPTEPLELSKAFFFLLKRRNSSWFIVCFTTMSLKRNSATVCCCLHERTLVFFSFLFFLLTEKVMFLWGFHRLLVYKKGLDRSSEEHTGVCSFVIPHFSWFPLLTSFLFLVRCQFPFCAVSNKSLKGSLVGFFMSLFYTWVLLCYPDPHVPTSSHMENWLELHPEEKY